MTVIPVNTAVLLRQYHLEDAEMLFAKVQENRHYLQPWLPWAQHYKTVQDAIDFIEKSKQDIEHQQGLALGIFENGILVGGIGFHDWEQDIKRAKVGYWLAKSATGKGLMQKCLQAMLQFGFVNMDLNKVELHYAQPNERSGKVATRAGFSIEGILRDSVMHNGALSNAIITGLLKKEFLYKKDL